MMRLRTVVWMAVLGPVVLGSMAAQQTPPPAKAPAAAEEGVSVDQRIQELGDESFRTRLQAERALRELGEVALPALREAAEASPDHEVQWRARRLIRQIEGREAGGLVQRSGRRAPPPDGRAPDAGIERDFDALFRDFEQRFGLDIPRARFFHDDFFRDLQEQMRTAKGRSQGMTMQIGPDGGVRVEVEETDADGERSKKVYEAPDMETFRAQYPDVLQRGGLGFDLRLWSGDGAVPSPFGQLQRGWSRPWSDPFGSGAVPGLTPRAPTPAVPAPTGPKLGVAVWPELPVELRTHLGLADGVGLMVQSVAPDSLASALGLAAGDIVTRIGDRAVGSPGDVREALGAIAVGGDVPVTFLRKGATQTATAKRQAEPSAGDGEDTDPSQPLRPRSGAGAPKVR